MTPLPYIFSRELIASIRAKPRPILLECDTLRMRGHGEHDDSSYVPKELKEQYAARDPLLLIRDRLVKDGVAKTSEWEALERECLAEVDRAYHEALADPRPDPSTLTEGVYADA